MPPDKSKNIKVEFELEQIKLLKENLAEWDVTISELERRCEEVSHEDNEWKARYETQVEYNKQLQTEAGKLKTKLSEQKDQLKQLIDNPSSIKQPKVDMKAKIKDLTRKKQNLQSQLRNYRVQLDEEAKLYHKADEKRRHIMPEIIRARASIVEKHEKYLDEKLHKGLKNLQRKYTNKMGPGVPQTISTQSLKKPDPKGYAFKARRRKSLALSNMPPNKQIIKTQMPSKISTQTKLPKIHKTK